MKKTIFITGASTGLGRATAILFAEKGWKVIATMRNPKKDSELGKVDNILVLPLDVTDPEQIKSTCFLAIQAGVDVVFNNAGYGLAGPFEGASDEQVRQELDTNLLGVMRVTAQFIPHFRAKKSGVFLTTTSIGGLVTFPFNSVYHATKWGLEGWSESLSFELKPFGIQVKTIAPGGISTDFASRSLVLTPHPAYESLANKVMAVFSDPRRQKNYSSAEQIAHVVFETATDGKSQLRYIAGKDAKRLYKIRRRFGYKFFVNQITKRFFQ
ncbi:MAG: SDR family oxidoreductase [Saprospiraceae bacterium]|nr:SDR family oxidoreductase [Saprospiraceae bacterium]